MSGNYKMDLSFGENNSKSWNNRMALTGDGQLKGLIFHSFTYDPASLNDGAGETKSVTVLGASIGDPVIVGPGIDIQDMTISAHVQAADTVEIRVQNEAAAARNLASSTWNIIVFDVT